MVAKSFVRSMGISLIAISAALGLLASGYVLYGPAPSGTLPISPAPIVLLWFWGGVVALVAGLIALVVANRMPGEARYYTTTEATRSSA